MRMIESILKKVWAGAGIAVVAAGCLTASAPSQVASWTIEFQPAPAAASVASAETTARGNARIAQVSVRAPYDAREIAVLRSDGSMAFDPYNRFASMPAALLRGALQDAFLSHGAFRTTVASGSQLETDVAVEATVTRLALDCREEGKRTAVVELTILLLRDRAVYASARGEGTADAADGNYTQAFSQAFSRAVASALSRL